MAKIIKFEFEGKNYTLEYTRASVIALEKQGFNINDVSEKPLSTLPTLFHGAFYAHHRLVKKDTIDKIFDHMGNKMELVAKLAEMYNEPIESLITEPEDEKLNWEASW